MKWWTRRATATVTVVLLSFGLLGVIPAAAEIQNNPEYPSVPCGGEWHWVHNQLPDGVESGTLTVVFEGMTPVEVVGEFNGAVMHYYLVLGGPATLVSAQDDIDGGMLLLSHWPECQDETTTTTGGDTTSSTAISTTTSTTGGSSTTSTTGGGTTSTSVVDVTTTTTSVATTTTTFGETTSTSSGDTTTTTGAVSSSTVTTLGPSTSTTFVELTTTTTSVDDPGSLTIVKRTIPIGAPGRFTIEVTARVSGQRWTVLVGDGESATIENLAAGEYSVVEIPGPEDWQLVSIICDDGSFPAVVGVDGGENVTCEVTNQREAAFDTTVTTVPPVSATTLPFTGADIARMTLVGLALAGTGGLVLSLAGSRRKTA